jgi:hypothetical protein
MTQRNVLITGARAPIALDLARSFAAAGWVPHLADSVRPWAARLQRVARGRLHRLPPPRFDFLAFVQGFGRLVAELDPLMIIPTCEEVFYVSAAAERLGLADRVFAPPSDTLRQLHSKVEFAALARRCGLSAPATRRVTSAQALGAWRNRGKELVLKPEFSRFAAHVLVQPNEAAFDTIVPTPAAPWAVQDYVEGEEFCLWSAARRGEIVGFAAYRPKWRVGRSASFYFEADRDPAFLYIARTIALATGATGQLSYDVIRRDDGTVAPIECNPRGVSGIHLFDSASYLAKAIMGQTTSIASVSGKSDIALPLARARHLAPAMWLLGAPQAIASRQWSAFRQDLADSRDVLAVAGEPLAALGALVDAGRFALTGLSRGRSAAGQSTDDIEWNGEALG